MALLSNQLRVRLIRLKAALRRVANLGRRRGVSLAGLREDLAPVFIIGANRSGTSVVSSIFSQHPDLEGLYESRPVSRTDAIGHSLGFAESMHVWKTLLPDFSKRQECQQLPFWALPQYLSEVYRSQANSDRERFRLAWDIERLRRSDRRPLLKDHFNMLRIGLIADILPRARFILVSRRFGNFAERAVHKWTHDGSGTKLRVDDPRLGLHWHLVNLIARYDLEAYAQGRYTEVWLHQLHESETSAQNAMGSAAEGIGLSPFEFDCEELAPNWDKPRQAHSPVGELVFDEIQAIVELERTIITSVASTVGHEER